MFGKEEENQNEAFMKFSTFLQGDQVQPRLPWADHIPEKAGKETRQDTTLPGLPPPPCPAPPQPGCCLLLLCPQRPLPCRVPVNNIQRIPFGILARDRDSGGRRQRDGPSSALLGKPGEEVGA